MLYLRRPVAVQEPPCCIGTTARHALPFVAFHLVALKHGGSCGGAPGLRPMYGQACDAGCRQS
ncbi:hypothetical protein XarbCFBP8130_16610 [Xanthomonas arboricola]|nr:hypothetical protein XarbCFBP8153_19025 [Xanthomonas arboricola]PPT62271.1 hypothetical protein XarbCFBP8130_16610 [Xanthomonas arboricola]